MKEFLPTSLASAETRGFPCAVSGGKVVRWCSQECKVLGAVFRSAFVFFEKGTYREENSTRALPITQNHRARILLCLPPVILIVCAFKK